MRRTTLVIALVLFATLASSAFGASTFVIRGKGWGHGVGLSQYGTLGFAREGATSVDILRHYFQGTELGPAPITDVRVLLAEGRRSVKLRSAARFIVIDARGKKFKIPAGIRTLNSALRLKGGGKPRRLVGPVEVRPRKQPIEVNGRPYRGTLMVYGTPQGLQIVNHLSLEDYLYGVVPGEIPASWPGEALKTQAIAARSFALGVLRPEGTFDLYSDTRSQVYGGMSVEDPRTSAAVDATAGQVVLHEGKVATTFFFSTSGGATAASIDVWGTALPYLVSVEDPHDVLSPYHEWGPIVLSGKQLKKGLRPDVPRGLQDATVNRNGSNRVRVLNLHGRTTTQVTGATVRARLGLRSTWFDIAVLTVRPKRGKITAGQKAAVTGIVRGLDEAYVEKKLPGGAWELVGPVTIREDGTFKRRVGKPTSTTLYRLTADGASTAPVRIKVVG